MALTETSFHFPNQTNFYKGKVRDVYTINEDRLIMVATDRISAFDVMMPKPIPHKGQVLNQIAAHFLKQTNHIAPNWLEEVPDPNVSVGKRCDPFKVEMVIRGSLVGHSWRVYEAGVRELCGVPLNDGLKEYDFFDEPIITPTTKADEGHDIDITPLQLIEQGIIGEKDFERLTIMSRQLFIEGKQQARKQGLVLADTKYEFGKLDDEIYVIDEIHTPDSSRYFYADSYDAYLKDRTLEPPKHLSKEFLRKWLLDQGFSGLDGQQVPEMSDEFVNSVSERYIELFEKLTGEKFNVPKDVNGIEKRIEKNIKALLTNG